jgi:hypothetical protein
MISIETREIALSNYIVRAKRSDVPADVQSYLFRHGAILVCGHVEQCVKLIILERLKNKAHPKIINFVKSHFNHGHNLDCNAIKSLLDRFETNWGKAFEKFIHDNDDIKEGIASAYSVRNPIAHGGTASLGDARLTELFNISKRLIEGVVKCTSA